MADHASSTPRRKAVFNWSGGKDSSLCLHKVLAQGEYAVTHLLTSVSQQYQRISMHGVRVELLRQQAASIGIPLVEMPLPESADMPTYDALVRETMLRLKGEGAEACIFGDIFLEDLRQYRVDQLARIDMGAVFPLWKIPTDRLVREFIDLGFKGIIACVDERCLDQSFAGRLIDDAFLRDLPDGVDPCGENGEFHSFVYDGPIFREPVEFTRGEVVRRTYAHSARSDNSDEAEPQSSLPPAANGFWYCDFLPVA